MIQNSYLHNHFCLHFICKIKRKQNVKYKPHANFITLFSAHQKRKIYNKTCSEAEEPQAVQKLIFLTFGIFLSDIFKHVHGSCDRFPYLLKSS